MEKQNDKKITVDNDSGLLIRAMADLKRVNEQLQAMLQKALERVELLESCKTQDEEKIVGKFGELNILLRNKDLEINTISQEYELLKEQVEDMTASTSVEIDQLKDKIAFLEKENTRLEDLQTPLLIQLESYRNDFEEERKCREALNDVKLKLEEELKALNQENYLLKLQLKQQQQQQNFTPITPTSTPRPGLNASLNLNKNNISPPSINKAIETPLLLTLQNGNVINNNIESETNNDDGGYGDFNPAVLDPVSDNQQRILLLRPLSQLSDNNATMNVNLRRSFQGHNTKNNYNDNYYDKNNYDDNNYINNKKNDGSWSSHLATKINNV
ncbi:hypothetical protein HELRODRAFT_194363 [Helobdella robusta]|uniref:Uncharacterized protein n=1 Tax=Helobdella robusta TaxID=6412 RepID=T1FVZ6_HELRO|nr:hypothetical protein HELRODRAFT_194363 [Helobdella robusta]ESN92231.1 hypothetical protein HELRODRAFT_194363 [Helobdella robusta]